MDHRMHLSFNKKTKELVKHLIVHKFQRNNVDLTTLGIVFHEDRANISEQLLDALEGLVEKYENLSRERYMGLCAEVSVLESDISNEFLNGHISKEEAIQKKRSVFCNVLGYLFPDKASIRWGRIIGMLAFTRELALYEVRNNVLQENMVMLYVDWAVQYMTQDYSDIKQWIMDQPNQWDDLIQYASSPSNSIIGLLRNTLVGSYTSRAVSLFRMAYDFV